jgi:hypothetical protein
MKEGLFIPYWWSLLLVFGQTGAYAAAELEVPPPEIGEEELHARPLEKAKPKQTKASDLPPPPNPIPKATVTPPSEQARPSEKQSPNSHDAQKNETDLAHADSGEKQNAKEKSGLGNVQGSGLIWFGGVFTLLLVMIFVFT